MLIVSFRVVKEALGLIPKKMGSNNQITAHFIIGLALSLFAVLKNALKGLEIQSSKVRDCKLRVFERNLTCIVIPNLFRYPTRYVGKNCS